MLRSTKGEPKREVTVGEKMKEKRKSRKGKKKKQKQRKKMSRSKPKKKNGIRKNEIFISSFSLLYLDDLGIVSWNKSHLMPM